MATALTGLMAAASLTPVITLLDLPNEILLGITARVPYSPDGCSIVGLRLVNRQLRDLLTDAASLRQVRNDVADIQYATASLFRRSTGDVSWTELDEMQATTSMVGRVAENLENGVKENASIEHDDRPYELDLIYKGLHLLEAVSRLRIRPSSEVESAVVLQKGLGETLTALLRLVSIRIKTWLSTRGEVDEDLRSLLSRPSSAAAIENVLVRKGLTVIDLEGGTVGEVMLLQFAQPFDAELELIDSCINLFTSYMAFTDESGLHNSTHWHELRRLYREYAGPSTFGVVANDLLVLALWRQVDFTRTEAFQAQRCLSNEFAQVARGANESQQIPDLRKADWYKFVEDNISRMAVQSRSAFRLKEDGSCKAAEWFRNAVRTRDPDILPSIRRTRPMDAHFATLIMTGVVEGQG